MEIYVIHALSKRLASTYPRRWDQRWHKRLWKRPKTVVSANTPTSSRMLASSYGWVSNDWIAGDVSR